MMNQFNKSTSITPNAATNAAATNKLACSKTPGYVKNILNKLRSIIENKYNYKVDPENEEADLKIDDITNLEILMDLEDHVPNLVISDMEFGKCHSFREMSDCVKRALSEV